MIKDLLDQKIIYYAIKKENSSCYSETELCEEVLDILQELRIDQKGKEMDTFSITNKINSLKTEAKLKRGDLVRVGNVIIPSSEGMKSWDGYTSLSLL